jgi:hypothetical protein
MRADGNEICHIFLNHFKNHADIASYINATVTRIFSMQLVIIQDWVEGVGYKQISPCPELFLFDWAQLFIFFFKVGMEVYDHRLLSQRSIALAEENAGEIFFPALRSFSARPMSFSSHGVMRGTTERCSSLLRTNSARNVLTITSNGSPNLAATFSACFLMFLSAFIVDAVFIR